MSEDVMHAVLQTALLGFFSDFTTREITFTLNNQKLVNSEALIMKKL